MDYFATRDGRLPRRRRGTHHKTGQQTEKISVDLKARRSQGSSSQPSAHPVAAEDRCLLVLFYHSSCRAKPAGPLGTHRRRARWPQDERTPDCDAAAPTESVAFRSPIWHRRAAGRGHCRSGCGCSSGVEHNLAKVGVEGSNPFARSSVLGRPHVCSSCRECGG